MTLCILNELIDYSILVPTERQLPTFESSIATANEYNVFFRVIVNVFNFVSEIGGYF